MSRRGRFSVILLKSLSGVLITGLIVIVLIAVMFFTKSSYELGYAVFNPTAYDDKETKIEITIPENAGNRQVASILYKNGLVKSQAVTYLQLKLSKYTKKVEAGTYVLNTSMLPDDMFAAISKSDENVDKEKESK